MNLEFLQDTPELDDLIQAYDKKDYFLLQDTWTAIAKNNISKVNRDFKEVMKYQSSFFDAQYLDDILKEDIEMLDLDAPEEVQQQNLENDLNMSHNQQVMNFNQITEYIEMFENHVFNLKRIGLLTDRFKEYVKTHPNNLEIVSVKDCDVMKTQALSIEQAFVATLHDLDKQQQVQTRTIRQIAKMRQDLLGDNNDKDYNNKPKM